MATVRTAPGAQPRNEPGEQPAGMRGSFRLFRLFGFDSLVQRWLLGAVTGALRFVLWGAKGGFLWATRIAASVGRVVAGLLIMAAQNVEQIPVLHGTELCGLLTREALRRAVQVRRELHPRV